jgi:transitional endoplasmic reticulum ATPase
MPPDDELIHALHVALQSAPDNLPLRKHLAELLLKKERYKDAENEYRQALELAPRDTALKCGLADAYFRQGKPDVALFILDELLRSGEHNGQVYLLKARIHLAMGSQGEAAAAYADALRIDASLVDADLEKQLQNQPAKTEPEERPKVRVSAEPQAPAASTDVEKPGLTFKDVGGMEKLKEEIRMKIIHPLVHPEIYKAYGKSIGGGILMYGPPGCGKTHIARATAGEVQAHFMGVGIHDVLNMYLGQSESNLHDIFELARVNTPCVLFFDEVDALGASRTDMRHSAGRHVINQFLAEMDGVASSNEGVLVLAATNAPWHLDPALRRPGRFDRVLFVPPPDFEARKAILRILLADKPVEGLDYERLSRDADEFSGADLKGVVDQAVERKLAEAMRRGSALPISGKDLSAVIKDTHPTTREWFATARNYALFANQGGLYDDIVNYLEPGEKPGLLPKKFFKK